MNNKGFTLIELLVVLTIVGILTSIAIPQYQEYKKKAYDARAMSDLRNIALAEETYFLDNETYLSCLNNNCTSLPGISTLSKGVTLQITGDDNSFLGTSTHTQGSGKIYTYDSDNGGFQ